MKGMWGEGAGFCTFFFPSSSLYQDECCCMRYAVMDGIGLDECFDSSGRRTGTTAAYGAEVLERFEDWSWKYLTIIRNISI